ncbi:hypothetical protein LINGRAHAP2_LOCUS31494 [Linum grandiflorum]
MKLALVADELNKRMEEIVETMKIVNIRVVVASGKSRLLPDRPGPSTRLTIASMADQIANREWKLRLCDCKAPVCQRIVHLGVGMKRIFLECQQWEYGVGCHWLVLVYGRKARGGFLQSGSILDRVTDDFSTENARLQVIVSNQAKKLEDIAEAFLAVTARQGSSRGGHLHDEKKKTSLSLDLN